MAWQMTDIEWDDGENAPKYDWRTFDSTADWMLVLERQSRTICVHLNVMAATSDFFSYISQKKFIQCEPDDLTADNQHTGEFNIKTAKSTSIKIGKCSMTVRELKNEIRQKHGISQRRQRFFIHGGNTEGGVGAEPNETNEIELDEEWRTLSGYGLTKEGNLMLILRKPWQRTVADEKTTFLNISHLCAEVIENFLDFQYENFNYPGSKKFMSAISCASPSQILAMRWLALHFQARSWDEFLLTQYHQIFTPMSAHEFMDPAIELGFEKVINSVIDHSTVYYSNLQATVLAQLPLDIPLKVLDKFESENIQLFQLKVMTISAIWRKFKSTKLLDLESFMHVWTQIKLPKNNELPQSVPVDDLLLLLNCAIDFDHLQLRQMCMKAVASCFRIIAKRKEDVEAMKVSTLVELLSRDDLAIRSDDEVAMVIKSYLAKNQCDSAQKKALWYCCRFALCSLDKKVELLSIPEITALSLEFLQGMVATCARETIRPELQISEIAQARERNTGLKWSLDKVGSVLFSEECLTAVPRKNFIGNYIRLLGTSAMNNGVHWWRISFTSCAGSNMCFAGFGVQRNDRAIVGWCTGTGSHNHRINSYNQRCDLISGKFTLDAVVIVDIEIECNAVTGSATMTATNVSPGAVQSAERIEGIKLPVCPVVNLQNCKAAIEVCPHCTSISFALPGPEFRLLNAVQAE